MKKLYLALCIVLSSIQISCSDQEAPALQEIQKIPTLNKLAFEAAKPDVIDRLQKIDYKKNAAKPVIINILQKIDYQDNFEVVQFFQAYAPVHELGEFMADFRNTYGNEILSQAIQKDNLEKVEKLIDLNAIDIYQQNNYGENCLHRAASFNAHKVAELLIAHNVDIHQRNVNGETPLYLAVRGKGYETTNLLVAAGAHINQQDNSGDTPLHTAVKFKYDKLIKLLLAEGADTEIINNDEQVATDLIADKSTRKLFDQYLKKSSNTKKSRK